MKENKFRIWSDRQGMIYPDGVFILCTGTHVLKLDPQIEENRYFIAPISDFDIEQLSPIKDKVDKEIYEGDIIRYNPFNSLKEPITSICPPLSHFHWWSDLGMMLDFDNKCEIEVIGNIHTKPELLFKR